MATKKSIIWFRKGLRLHDNPALLEACKDAAHVYPVFVLDPYFLQNSSYKVSVNRYNFLLESLSDLDNSFKARGSRLLVLRGKPEEVFPRVFKDWGITSLCYEVDTEPYARARDAAVGRLAAEAGVAVHEAVSHTLYDTEMLVARAGGTAPATMQSFLRLVDRVGPPPAPAPDPPAALPPPAPGAAGTEPEATGVPGWQEMGFKEPPATIFKGGESEALSRLAASFADPAWVAGFQKPDTDPSAFERPATTVLSPYLKFGCLSPRLFHAKLLAVYAARPGHSQPPQSLRGQLLWREFFYTVGAATPHFDRMAGNPLCRQVDWDSDPELLAAWREARTGYPWIDAIMTQLREWGWIHHLARHSAACFLTRGDLWQSWEAGRDVFEELLIDQDHYLNAANWMWLSASAFFNQYFRVYSPVAFGRKYDPEGRYVRRFLPVLRDMPSKYIYEPWKAPLEVQRRAGCIIGRDYPAPIVDHAVVSKANIARMAAAYARHRDGGGEAAGAGDAPASAGDAASSAAAAAAAASSFAAGKAAGRGGGRGGGGRGKGAGGAAAAGGRGAAKSAAGGASAPAAAAAASAVAGPVAADAGAAAAKAAALKALKGGGTGTGTGTGRAKRQRTIKEALGAAGAAGEGEA